MLFAPLEGWRRVEATERRAKTGWAQVVRQLVDVDYPEKDRIVLVMDHLNTHHPASLYEAFEPAEARRIAERLEIHYTPKHGSWLNMAEIELAVLARQCLDRRIPDQETLGKETQAWQDQRNRESVRANWRFTTQDARIKLRSLYPFDGLLGGLRRIRPIGEGYNDETTEILGYYPNAEGMDYLRRHKYPMRSWF